jgi:hypothetical protein
MLDSARQSGMRSDIARNDRQDDGGKNRQPARQSRRALD